MAVIVAALGYFVDIYDLTLFGVLRVTSLVDLGVPADRLKDVGLDLLQWQMMGMLVGGILWGVLGDKLGRLRVLFGSILLYSLANLANARVESVSTYAILRFVAGVGLAGELGAGVTLVAELMGPARRGLGTTIVAATGLCGAVAAYEVFTLTSWRTSYVVGGCLGLSLLFLRIGTFESGMFEKIRATSIRRGSFFSLFKSRDRLLRYFAVILIGVPIWYVVGIFVFFAPELGLKLGLDEAPVAGIAIEICYAGLAVGDIASGLLSQAMRNRRRVVFLFLLLTMASIGVYALWGGASLAMFYTSCGLLGFATGYWAVFVTMAAEQFGTNIRATVATTAPNFVRGSTTPVTGIWRGLEPVMGTLYAALATGVLCFGLAFVALRFLHETYGKDLDYVEE